MFLTQSTLELLVRLDKDKEEEEEGDGLLLSLGSRCNKGSSAL
jgi:hypothetical protein